MGIEYRANIQGLSKDRMDEILRAAPYFVWLLTDYGLYEYRSPQNQD